MTLSRAAAFLLGTSFTLAGCVKGDATAAEPDHSLDFGGSSESGSIHGIVVDDLLLPVSSANVTIDDLQRALVTNNAGVFAFADVPIGEHALLVSAHGYGSVSLKVDVIAETTSHADVTLKRVATDDAYYNIQVGKGLFGCGATYRQSITTVNGAFFGLAGCATGAEYTGLDDFVWDTVISDQLGLWRGGSFETEWVSNQAFGNGMVQDWAVRGCDNNRNATFTRDAGPSPLSETLNAFQLDYRLKDMTENATCGSGDNRFEANTRCNDVDGCQIQNRMFSWPSTFGQGSNVDIGITIQQQFTTYFSEFYRAEPPRGFSALPDA
jgi:hypothetical protein